MSPRPNPLSPGNRPIRRVQAIATAMVCAAALSVAPVSADDGSQRAPKIKGTVGPGYSLSFRETSVPAGKYRVVIQDRSTIHNFHLKGPGDINIKTQVEETGRTVWRLDLLPGTYHAQCDPHSSMNDDLVVT